MAALKRETVPLLCLLHTRRPMAAPHLRLHPARQSARLSMSHAAG
jgi:hypothetical protein